MVAAATRVEITTIATLEEDWPLLIRRQEKELPGKAERLPVVAEVARVAAAEATGKAMKNNFVAHC